MVSTGKNYLGLNKELWEIWNDDRAIGIDCDCGYEQGRLACLRLDDMKVFYSEK